MLEESLNAGISQLAPTSPKSQLQQVAVSARWTHFHFSVINFSFPPCFLFMHVLLCALRLHPPTYDSQEANTNFIHAKSFGDD